MNEKISVETASKVLGISPNEIRKKLKKGDSDLPIGHARRSCGAKKTYRYDVYKNMVMQYAGLAEWPEGV